MGGGNIDEISQQRPHRIAVFILTLLTLLMTLPGLANLPVIDRDEARFATASVQMAQSGDYVSIRFQDEARNKKPVGVYWAQTVMIKIFGDRGERHLWAQRLPSVFAAILAVLATYWAAIPMIGRRGGLIAGALLAVSALFVFEGHIAKTDALLTAMGALIFVSFAHLRAGGGRFFGLLFWLAMGFGVMIKGPVILGLAILTLFSLWLWEREATWMKALTFWLGPLLFLLIVLPWSILIFQATEGQFFKDALVGDFGNKIAGAQENHGAPPGAYLLTLPITFWPASLFLLPGLAFAFRAVKKSKGSTNPVIKAMRLCLCWALPFWLVLELVPTKLPNYLLPTYPALAVMCAVGLMTLFKVKEFTWSRRIGAVLFALVSIALITALFIGESLYGPSPKWSYGPNFLALLFCFFAAFGLWTARGKWALVGVMGAAIMLQPFTYQVTLPRLDALRLSDRVEASIVQKNIPLPRKGGPDVYTHNFTEPSLVYRLGKDVILGDKIDVDNIAVGNVVLVDILKDDSKSFLAAVKTAGHCLEEFDAIEGHNYSKGDAVKLTLFETVACAPEPVTQP